MLKLYGTMRQLLLAFAIANSIASQAFATPFTTTVPGTGVALPDEYPEAGGVAIVLTGVNGNIYYQFSDPDGAFRGFQNRGTPTRFRGNPFTINDPIALDCGFRTCTDYFGGQIVRADIRFTALDGDTQPGGFDENDIELLINGFNVGSWSGRQTEATNTSGTTSFGLGTGFGNNTFDTGWFSSQDPALLNNILATGQTVSQVLDADPNDNFWDFRGGNSLPDEELRTIAPGYELEKTRRDTGGAFGVSGSSTYLSVGEQITYDFVVRNIGSVDIANVQVTDDQIGPVACAPTSLPRTTGGAAASEAQCTGIYTVTQADVDAGTITNIAQATGDPEFGQLGTLSDSVTLTALNRTAGIDFEKTANPTTFTAAGEQITFTLRAINTGDVTLSNVVISDPMFPGQNCTFASIAPLSTENADNEEECTITYTILQEDVDNAAGGSPLVNTATVNATDPDGGNVNAADGATITGPTTLPAMTVSKTATPQTFSAVGDIIDYAIVVTNTGNVTWTTPVIINDPLTDDEVCPNATVAPGASVTCTASYEITQLDLDAETLTNTVDAEITVNGVTANGDASETIAADVMPLLTIEKTLLSGADPFSATTDELVYQYVLRNEGNVVLNNISLTDDQIGLTCPATSIAGGASITCTSDPYAVSQSDLDTGSVTNIATATSETGQGGAVPDATATLTISASQAPSLSLLKEAEAIAPGDFQAGATVDYTYTYTNDGNVTLAGPFTVNDDKFANPIACGTGPLLPGASQSCNASYTVLSEDVGRGFVLNNATVTDGTATSPSESVTVPQSGTPAIMIAKSAITTDFAAIGDPIDYSFLITNSGDTVIDGIAQPVTVSDPAFAASGDAIDCSSQPGSLLPGQSFSCTGTYTGIDQADIDAGSFRNEASASFTFGTDTIMSNTSTATVTANITPAFTLTKTAPSPAQFSAVGEEVEFTFRVTNDTNQTIATATVTDPLIPGLDCDLTNIAPFGFQECTGSIFIDQDDMDTGSVTNLATVNGTSSTGANIPSSSDTATVTIAPGAVNPNFTLDKQATTNAFTSVGDRISYVFEVVNTGNLTLTDVVVSDPALGLTCNVPSLAPGLTDRSCFADKVITQEDIDNGSFVNTATGAATGVPNQIDTETATGPNRTPSFTFSKSASGGFTAVGDIVRYNFEVVNTGNVTLTDIAISDSSAALAPTTFACTIPSLAPGVTDTTSCFFDYTVRQADLDLGVIDNTATVTADAPVGPQLNDSASATANGPTEVIDLVVEKVEETPDGVFTSGSTEAYLFTVTNNSNVTVTGLSLTDPLTGLSCTLPDLAPATSTTQCADTTPLRDTYTTSQADVDRGSVTNEVTVSGATTRGTSVEAMDQLTLLGPDQMPALTIDKTSPTSNFAMVGDTIDYSYLVTNTGNVTITAPITVDDDRASVTCPALPTGGLAPLASITCTATYAVDQDDLDNNGVTNVAAAEVTQPVVPSTTYPGGIAAVTSLTDTVTVPAAQMPALTLDKRVKSTSASTYGALTDVITFEFEVTNTGNVTTTNPITITDADLGLTGFSCGPANIAPGASVLCEAPWSPSQGDINNASFTNTASAETVFGAATVASPNDSATVQAIRNPRLTAEKVIDPTTTLNFATGQTVTYNYTATNTGNETINGPIEVTDNLIGTIVCDPGPLDPGDVATCSDDYVLTTDDVRLGSVTNIASISGTTTGGVPVESDPTSETIPEAANPAIEITKTADVASFANVGDVITYTYTVTNRSLGNPDAVPPQAPPALANDIVIVDDQIAGDIACYTSTTANPELNPGETVTCSAQGVYTVTQEDLDAVDGTMANGFVTNNAFAQSSFGTVDPLTSDPVQVTVPGDANPLLTVDKAVTDGPTPAAVGDVLEFAITVANDGNQTLSGVLVTDPLIPALSCEVATVVLAQPLTLDSGAAAICVGDYTVTQDNVDAQTLANTATATGTNPQGTPVQSSGGTTHPIVPEAPGITIDKDLADGEPGTAFAAVGQEVTYSIEVENTGNVTLVDVEVTDILFPGEVCTIGTLGPDAVDSTTCSFTYMVLQEDIDRGTLNNEATVTAITDTPSATPVENTDTLAGTGPDREPNISINKDTAVAGFSTEGDVIPYTFVVANTGNVTITAQPSVVDDNITLVNCDTIPSGGLLPGGFINCAGNYTITQQNVDAGFFTNEATASVTDPINPASTLTATDEVTIDATRTPGLTISKAADDAADVVAGQSVTYTYTLVNTGNVTLTGIILDDQHATQAGTSPLSIPGSPVASIAPGTTVELTSTYTITQEDIDAGVDITNVVSAASTPPAGVTPLTPPTASETVTVADPDPSLEVIKTVTPPASLVPGETVIYTVTVENNGNVSLDNIRLTDTLRRNDGSLVSPSPTPEFTGGDTGTIGILDVNETWTYQVTHVLTQADIDAGGLSNSARALGDDPSGTTVTDTSDTGSGTGATPTPFVIPPMPEIEGEKVITSTATTLGATVQFEITATNTGNVTLSNVAVASDTLLRADGTSLTLANGPTFFATDAGSGAGTLQVGETATYRATYVLAQADIDAGGISNQAVVTGTPPVGGAVTDQTDDGDDVDGNTANDPTDLSIAANPSLDLDKFLANGGPTFDAVGDELTYNFIVTNTGNVTLTDPMVIDDPLIPDVTCDPTPLAPLASLTCTGIYSVLQEDLDRGEILNTATAQNGATESDPDDETVLAQQDPAMETLKEAVSITANGTTSTTLDSALFVTDAVVDYDFTVTNTGNVTLTEEIAVSDNLISTVSCPALPTGGLAPGDNIVCTGSYTVTAPDVSQASVTNLASASDGVITSPLVSETVPADGTPLLETLKEVTAVTNPDASASATLTFDEVGDVLTYTFTINNVGTVAFANDVVIVDDRISSSPLTCFTSSAADPDFSAGETLTCEADYVVTQDDLDAGEVVNQAFSQTTSGPDDRPVVSAPVDETTPADGAPAVTVSKAAETLPITGVGQTLTYTLTLENTGNQTLRDVRATDPLLPDLTCMIPMLAPGESDTCSDTYEVLQRDIDAGELLNTAEATAITPDGGSVEDETELTLAVPAADPELTLTKTATPDPFGAVGSAITYVFEVGNPGNVTLFDVTVTDPRIDPVFSCSVSRLDVGSTDDSCTVSYTITQEDKDAGEIENTAAAQAADPFGTVVEIEDTISTPSMPAMPGIESTKTVSGATALGSPVSYTLTLRNTGDVTLDVGSITDTMTRIGNTTTTALDAPFGGLSGDADLDGLLDVTEVWVLTATHVLTQADIDQGGLRNTVTVDATDPFGTLVSDVSDNGDDGDGNSVDDPTDFVIVPGPAIEAVKTVATGGSVAGDNVVFEIAVTNTGDVTLTEIAVSDDLTRTDGTVLVTDGPATQISPTTATPSMAPGDTFVFQFAHVLSQEDVDAGGLINTATAVGTPPAGPPVSDISDNGDDGDGNLTDDATQLTITPAPAFEAVKTARTFPDGAVFAGAVVIFDVTVTNSGNVTLQDLVVTDNLTNLAGDVLTPDAVTFASGASETEIGAGEANTYAVTYTLTQEDVDAGGVENSFVADVTTPAGVPLTDISDDGDDGDGNTLDDPTQILIAAAPALEATKVANVPVRLSGAVFEVVFDMTVTNTGNITETDLIIEDDLEAFVSPATLVSTSTPIVSGFASGGSNPTYDGSTDISLVTPGTSLAPGETATIQITVAYDTTDGSPEQPNRLVVQGSDVSTLVTVVANVSASAEPDIFASKTVTPDDALLGATVTYNLQFENRLATAESGLTFVDLLPAGVAVDPSTARYNGAETPAAILSGQRLIWEDVSLGPDEVVTITFEARVTGGPGEIINRAYVLNSDGEVVSNVAEAAIVRRPEPVFECSDVIGKVFDDRNQNGYQDGVQDPDRSLITDQTYDGGKFTEAPVVTGPDYEPGLPNVRVVTVDGIAITTDEFGRFSVPCADLPAQIGSNFTLKLDERTLPTGYRVTTENPRVVRLTAGTVTKLNFGAAISRVVDIDLMASAFQQGTSQPTAALIAGIDQLVRYLGEAPSVLRLTYYRNGEGADTARSRLDRVEGLVRERWQQTGVYRLLIEQTIRQVQ